MIFEPNYRHIVDAACNRMQMRVPLYEHIICTRIMERILGYDFEDLIHGDLDDKREFFLHYVRFFHKMGYDTVSFEQCIGPIMPGSGALLGEIPGVIKDRKDFMLYPWDDVPRLFFERYEDDFRALREALPEGMKCIGGPGNGVFECVQDVVGFTQLCYMKIDDPGLYRDLFRKVGDMMVTIWQQFIEKFGDIYAVCRFGDDLGFKTATLLAPQDIKDEIIPQYTRIVDVIHQYQKPFLLHSCGYIFEVMEELISIVKIDAKHSNEDVIAPFDVWIKKYGERIGNFGGVDTDVLCQFDDDDIRNYVTEVYHYSSGKKGVALGSGNSIPDYVPVSGYLTMVETIRELRGDWRRYK